MSILTTHVGSLPRTKNVSDLLFKRENNEVYEQKHFDDGMKLYKKLLGLNIAKECARMVLPLATPTRIYMTGSLRSWMHYINLRSAHGTQREHMMIANDCRAIFMVQFPIISEALEWTHA